MKYVVKKEMPGAKVGDILEENGGGALCKYGNTRLTSFVHIDLVQTALDQGFIEPYEEKSEMAELIEELSLALGDLYQAMDKIPKKYRVAVAQIINEITAVPRKRSKTSIYHSGLADGVELVRKRALDRGIYRSHLNDFSKSFVDNEVSDE